MTQLEKPLIGYFRAVARLMILRFGIEGKGIIVAGSDA
jgi:hypothetical protein